MSTLVSFLLLDLCYHLLTLTISNLHSSPAAPTCVDFSLFSIGFCFYAGRFFGETDGSVMTTLIQMGMFKRVSLFDYQAMCKTNPHSVSSARPLLSVSGGVLRRDVCKSERHVKNRK
uniref:Calcium channel, voltage-dependent, alpha 2/delta subunit 4a n=1 Tax=Poecilia reticulata TaxID=8081 RepID=A0A3P9N9Q9_POERE